MNRHRREKTARQITRHTDRQIECEREGNEISKEKKGEENVRSTEKKRTKK